MNETQLKPQFLINKLPTGWQVRLLGDVAIKIQDRDHYTPKYLDDGIPIISPRDFGENEQISFDKCQFISFEEHKKNRLKTDISIDDVIFTRIGSIGKACIVTLEMPEFSILHSCAMLRANKNLILPGFLLYSLKSDFLHLQLKTEIQSIGVPDLGLDKIKKFKVIVPPISEQHKITNILTTMDDSIDQSRVLIQKYQRIKKGLMHDLFMKGIDLGGHVRNQTTFPKQFKRTDLGFLPNNWNILRLEEIGANKPYAIVDGPFGSNLKSEHYRESGVPVIQSGFVTTGQFMAETYFYVDTGLFEAQKRSAVEPGEIIMAKIGAQCGRCAIMPKDHPIGILAGNCLKISTNENKCKVTFLLWLLHYLYDIGQIDQIKTETAQPAISLKNLRTLRIPIPPVEEQETIINILENYEKTFQNEKTYYDKLVSVKQGLLQDLLTGKVQPN